VSGQNFVFLDPGGRRWVLVRAIVGLGLLALLSLLVIFIRALWVKPEIRMPDSLRDMKLHLRAIDTSASCGDDHKTLWVKFAQAPHQRKRTGVPDSTQSRISATILLGGDGRGLNRSPSTHRSSPMSASIC
jgi:hypothetical protein